MIGAGQGKERRAGRPAEGGGGAAEGGAGGAGRPGGAGAETELGRLEGRPPTRRGQPEEHGMKSVAGVLNSFTWSLLGDKK